MTGTGPTPEQLFEGHPLALEAHRRVGALLAGLGPVTVAATRSQVAYRHGRGFAYLWLPGRWLRQPAAEVVLSIALDRRIDSGRFKDVVHPARTTWMHHLELHAADEIDAEVATWLREAWERAGCYCSPP